MTSRTQDTTHKPPVGPDLMRDLHADRLVQELEKLAIAMGARAATRVLGKVDGMSDRLTDFAEKGGSGLLSAVTGSGDGSGLGGNKGAVASAVTSFAKSKLQQGLGKLTGGGGGDGGGGGGGKGKKLKVTNIVETLDIGVPVRLAYDQWTQFEDFPSFMKKVENVEQESDEQLSWRAQVLWSHRDWESTIYEQIPDKRIVWRSKGAKGYVDGAVTFHELAPDLTRVALILEYHPQGFFEHTGNLWRAQGRRARLEFKHFARHMTAQAILHPDEIEGWRGEIRDGEVVKGHGEDEEGEEEGDYEDEEEEDYADEDEGEDEAEDADEESATGEGKDREDEEDEDRSRRRRVGARRT